MEEGWGVGANAVFVEERREIVLLEGLDERKELDCDQGLRF